MCRLDGRVALITGAARGIGYAISARLVEEGAIVALCDRDGAAALQAAATLGHTAMGLTLDVTQPTSLEQAFIKILQNHGPPSILVNNAVALTPAGTVVDLDVDDWDKAIAVNLTGAFRVSRAVIPHMRARGGGVIINVGSTLATVAVQEAPAYCASKGGLLQLTRAMALDHAKDCIRVNALSPGTVRTERLEDLYGSVTAATEQLAPSHPIGRIALPEEIAAAAAFLASDEATFMTGANMIVDGGYTAR